MTVSPLPVARTEGPSPDVAGWVLSVQVENEWRAHSEHGRERDLLSDMQERK
jgi:hypothetical protein